MMDRPIMAFMIFLICVISLAWFVWRLRMKNELRHMLYSALQYNCPVAIRYPRSAGLGVPIEEALQLLPLGKAEVLQQGSGITLLAYGSMVQVARQVAELLEQEVSVKATVVNARFVKPLDAETILSCVAAGDLLVTMEEHALAGGFGSAVLELLNEQGTNVSQMLRIGIGDAFVPHGKTDFLKELAGLDVRSVAEKIKTALREKQR